MSKETAEALNQFSMAVVSVINSLYSEPLEPIGQKEFSNLLKAKADLDQAVFNEANGKATGNF